MSRHAFLVFSKKLSIRGGWTGDGDCTKDLHLVKYKKKGAPRLKRNKGGLAQAEQKAQD